MKELLGARLQNFVEIAAAGFARRAAFRRRNLDKARIGGEAEQSASILLLEALGVFVGDFENARHIASKMIGPDGNAGGEQQRFAVVDDQVRRIEADVQKSNA